MELYIGLMSGTSADGIDAALVDFSQNQPRVIATHYIPYSKKLQHKITLLSQNSEDQIQLLGELDIIVGSCFAQAVNELLDNEGIAAKTIKAIGSHGQTIRHHPHAPYRFTIQIGDPNTITALTGITTVADFRRKDMAFGGQGAPLVPAFHQHMFACQHNNRAIVNIGGIANVTFLSQSPDASPTIGFDTGPGNTLLDSWVRLHCGKDYDKDGDWARQGAISSKLLASMLSDPYLQLTPPKSTGLEYFNLNWLNEQLAANSIRMAPVDVQATLVEFTASSIITTIRNYFNQGEIFVCGGGAHNAFLMQRLQILAQSYFSVNSTQQLGVDPDSVEAIAFAWLARQTLSRQTGNLPSVTGASQAAILGGIYYAHKETAS